MLLPVLTHVQLTPGFFPLAALLTGGAAYLCYMLLVRMKCKSRPAQGFIAAGMVFMAASLFLRLTFVTEKAATSPPTEVARQAVSHAIPSTTPGFPAFPRDRFKQALDVPRPSSGVASSHEPTGTSWTQWGGRLLPWYIVGGVLYLLYLAGQLASLLHIRRYAVKAGQHEGATLYHTDYEMPFSFARSIFIPADTDEEKAAFILNHEASHIRRGHFYKLLALQCLTALNWFNPFAYLFYRAMREQQEMEADRDVLDQGADREQYQIHLVLTCKEHREWIPVRSNYNYSTLKSRIIFMNKKIKNSNARLTFAGCMALCLSVCGCMDTKKEAPASPEPFDLQGCWAMQCIGDSAFRTTRTTDIVPHYKFIGKENVLTVAVTGRKAPDGPTFFSGKLGSFRMSSDSVAVEQGLECPVQRVDSASFNLSWYDPNGVSNIPGLWKTEQWVRHTPAGESRRIMQAYKECRERKDRLKGAWKMSAYIDRNTGEKVPQNPPQYKFFGKDHYFTVLVQTMTDMEGNPLYQFSGNGGTFEYVDGNHLRENGGDHRLQWDGDDTFTTTFLWDGVEFSEVWTRTEIPEELDRMLECTGL